MLVVGSWYVHDNMFVMLCNCLLFTTCCCNNWLHL